MSETSNVSREPEALLVEAVNALKLLMAQMERGTNNVRSDDWYAARDIAHLAIDKVDSYLDSIELGRR